MSLFNFLNVSPRSELRIRRRKMEGIQLNWKKFELEKAERVERYMDSLSVKAVSLQFLASVSTQSVQPSVEERVESGSEKMIL